ncbi:MAG: hypothetical protein H7144_12225 [Burkholderiales bacterium]|nr:hypothetical protein [Phycisphaerae bacterium]
MAIEQQQIAADIRELLVWTKAANFIAVRSLLREVLSDEKSKMIYQLSDGTRSVDEIRKACKASPNSVSELQQKCLLMGLMSTTESGKRVRLFDLSMFT